MLLFIDNSGELYFVDSHLHKNCGALIASAPPSNGGSFAEWIDNDDFPLACTFNTSISN